MASQRKFLSEKEKAEAMTRFYNNLSGDDTDESNDSESDSSDGKILLYVCQTFWVLKCLFFSGFCAR